MNSSIINSSVLLVGIVFTLFIGGCDSNNEFTDSVTIKTVLSDKKEAFHYLFEIGKYDIFHDNSKRIGALFSDEQIKSEINHLSEFSISEIPENGYWGLVCRNAEQLGVFDLLRRARLSKQRTKITIWGTNGILNKPIDFSAPVLNFMEMRYAYKYRILKLLEEGERELAMQYLKDWENASQMLLPTDELLESVCAYMKQHK